MLKYYFGYRSLFGSPSCLRWVEDKGTAIGGEVNVIGDNKYLITWKEFTYSDLASLKDKYPFKEPKTDETPKS